MRLRVAVCLVVCLLVPSVYAQNTDNEALSFIRFSLRNPGARALGMGGAFLGLADDASAAEANPAGLTILVKPEASVEVRHSRTYNRYPTRGTYLNDASLVRTTFAGSSEAADLAFASVVVPVRNFAFAAYYDHPLSFTNRIDTTSLDEQRLIQFNVDPAGKFYTDAECRTVPTCQSRLLLGFLSAVDVEMETFGASAAGKFGDFSAGLTARYQTLRLAAGTQRYDVVNGELTPTTLTFQGTDDEQHDVTFTGGVKWTPSMRFSAGLVYKQGASFETFAGLQRADGSFTGVSRPTFHVPDVAGAGVSFRVLPRLTVNVDAVRIMYSNLAEGSDGKFVSVTTGIEDRDFERPDVTELHAGVEYFFATRVPFAIRGGYWREPAHALQYTGPINTTARAAKRILLPAGEDENHYSIGAGLAWPRFQIDAAYETSDTFKVGSIAFVTRF